MDVESALKSVGTFGRFQKFMLFSACMMNIPYGFQMVLMVIVGATPNQNIPDERNMTTIVTEFNLQHKPWVVDLISSIFMAGFGIGCLVCGQVADLYGRKWTLIINYTLMHISGICLYFVNNWEEFAALRAVCGFCTGSSGHIVFTHMVENIGKEYWGQSGIIYSCFFSIGVVLLSVLGVTLQNWRLVCVVGSAIPLIAVPVYIFIIPESTRWLYHVGKVEQAEKALRYIAIKNGRPAAGITLCNVNDCELSNNEELRKYSVVDMFRRQTLPIYGIASFYIWFACSFVYYGLTFNAATLSPNIYIATILSGAIELPALAITFFAIRDRRIGRKGTLLFSLLLSSISGMGMLFAYGLMTEHLSTVEMIFGLTNKLAVAGAFGLLYIYAAEVFPTQLRLVAIGGSSMFARVGAILSPFVPLLAPVASYLPYTIFGVVSIVGAMCTLLLPETLNKPSPEMSDFPLRNSSKHTYSSFHDSDSGLENDVDPLI